MEMSYCSECDKSTQSIRQGRCHYVCNDCGYDKSLSDFYFDKATPKTSKQNSQHPKVNACQGEGETSHPA